jgi:hypothetical protein
MLITFMLITYIISRKFHVTYVVRSLPCQLREFNVTLHLIYIIQENVFHLFFLDFILVRSTNFLSL